MAIVSIVFLAMIFCAAAKVAWAAQAKPAWQAEWEKILEAAKKEGQLSIYISGYEEVIPDFQKEFPDIKVTSITGRGSQVGQRLLAERRADKFLADVVSAGGVTTYQQLFPAKVFDPIKPALLLPEINDVTKWYQGKHHYADPENQYIFSYVGTATYGSVSYNTKLVDVKDFKSYWDLLNPKWKGKIISRDIRAPGPGSGNARLFYYLPDVGPSFIKKLYGEMDATLFRDYRQGSDWLAVGKATICFFLRGRCVQAAGVAGGHLRTGGFQGRRGPRAAIWHHWASKPRAASQRCESLCQLAAVAQRSDRPAEKHAQDRESYRFVAHRHSQRRDPSAEPAFR